MQERYVHKRPGYQPSADPFEGTTTARATYAGTQGERAQPIRPVERQVTGAQGEYTTTNKQDMQQWPIPERHQISKPQYKPPSAKFEGQSTARADFQQASTASRASPIIPKDNQIGHSGPGEYTTTNRQEMQQWPVQERPRRQRAEYVPSSAKFDGTTTAKAEFVPMQAERAQPIKPESKSTFLRGSTEYK